MRFGVCTDPANGSAVAAAGFQFVEGSVQALLQGETPDEQWKGLEVVTACPLPVPCANLLVPASLKITGPTVQPDRLASYIQRVAERASKARIDILVFGSGGARNAPDGFDRNQARNQIIDFAKAAARAARNSGVTIVLEPLNRKECNIINSVAEAMQYVRAVNEPSFQCLVDTYHLWLEDEPIEHVREAIGSIKHVHVADRDGRVAPGESGKSDYRALFGILKSAGYTGLISVEGNFPDIAGTGARVHQFLQTQWKEA